MSKKIPFCELAHIDALTMAFVLSLRDNPEENNFMKNLSEEDKKLLEEEQKPLRKGQSECKSKLCKDVHTAIQMAILERAQLKREILNNTEIIEDNDSQITNISNEISAIDDDYNTVHTEFAHLSGNLAIKLKKLKEISARKRALESSITKAEKQLKKLSNNISSSSTVSSESMASRSLFKGRNEKDLSIEKKHTGVYCFVEAKGGICWSCCLSEEYNGKKKRKKKRIHINRHKIN